MNRLITMVSMAAVVAFGCTGCMSRLVREGAAVATGAAGKVVTVDSMPDLLSYRGLQVETIGIATNLPVPPEMPGLVREEFVAAAAGRGLVPDGKPALQLKGEIIHYETGGAVDTAIGPFEEVIVRATLTDGRSGKAISQANLIGRSKATTSAGPRNLSQGTGRALDRWLKAGGLTKAGEKE